MCYGSSNGIGITMPVKVLALCPGDAIMASACNSIIITLPATNMAVK